MGSAGFSLMVNKNPLISIGFDHHPALLVFYTKVDSRQVDCEVALGMTPNRDI